MDTQNPTPPADPAVWPIMVLAYNEEDVIEAALDSIFASEPGQKFDIYVMANGCTDRTEDLVRAYSAKHPEVKLVSIKLGDKCHAWNVFVQETAPTRCPGHDVYFFMCGDVRVTPGSLSAMRRALLENPYPNAASSPPGSGRNVERDRRLLIQDHAIVANLYALRGSFVRRLKETGARLPLNFEGDDALIGTLVQWDLAPSPRPMDLQRVIPVAESAWVFDSLSPTRIEDWKFYWKRAIRYARRHYEFKLLGPELKSKGLAGMPVDIQDLYPRADKLSLRWQGLYTLTNWIALRRMRQIGEARRA